MAASLGLLSTLAAISLSPSQVRADEREACFSAQESGQTERQGGRLVSARKQFLRCSQVTCPSMIQQDCIRRMAEVDLRLPTLLFEVRDEDGHDVASFTLKLDGAVVSPDAAARALPLDPGKHTAIFESPGKQTITRDVVAREGDQNRRERVVLVSSLRPATTPPPAFTIAPPSEPRRSGGWQRPTGLVVGVAGIAGLGVGGLLGGLASSKYSRAKQACSSPTTCPSYDQAVADHDSAVSLATGSTVAVIAGGALLGTGLVLYLTAPSRSSNVAIVPGSAGGAGATLTGSF